MIETVEPLIPLCEVCGQDDSETPILCCVSCPDRIWLCLHHARQHIASRWSFPHYDGDLVVASDGRTASLDAIRVLAGGSI